MHYVYFLKLSNGNKDQEYRIQTINKAFLEVYPQEKRDKIIGTTGVEGYPEDEVKEFLKMDRLALETGYSECHETISFPDGRIRTLFTRKIRFYDTNNEPFLLGVARDVTEKLKEEKILNEIHLIAINNSLNSNDRTIKLLQAGLDYFGTEMAVYGLEVERDHHSILLLVKRGGNMGGKKINILYVEDSPSDAALLEDGLERYGENYDITLDITESLSDTKKLNSLGKYSMILLDWNLPDANGLEVAEYICNTHKDSKIIFLSSALEQDFINKAQKFSPLTFLEKDYGREFIKELLSYL